MLQIRSIKKFTSLGSGNEVSTYDWVGIEFSGIREYTHTDDARLIEWRSSARGQKINMKKFETTTSLHISLITDVSKTLFFWSHERKSKFNLMRECTQAIYRSAHNYGHRIDWVAISLKNRKNITSQEHGHLSFLDTTFPNSWSLENSISKLDTSRTKNRLILILTDTLESIKKTSLSKLSKQNDIVFIHLFDVFELDPTWDMIIGDIKHSGYFPASRKKDYLQDVIAARKWIEQSFRSYWGYISISTNDKLIEKLNLYFRTRK